MCASNNRLIEAGCLETQKANHCVSDWLLYDYVVGAVGFEPTASCSQAMCFQEETPYH